MAIPEEDYRALREDAALLDLADWCVLRMTGSDTRAFLQGTATQDLTDFVPGTAKRTLFLSEKGRPVAMAWVACDEAGSEAFVIAGESARSTLRLHFERFRIMEDVEFEGPEGMPRLMGLAGPRHSGTLCKNLSGLRLIRAEPLSFVLSNDDNPDNVPRFAHAAAVEAWRLHVGLPRAGVDFDAERIATELELPEAISFDKGCYVGQEVVARTSHRGQVRRRRTGFRFPWPGVPLPPKAPIQSGGAAVGFVTSSALEPGSTDGLGMGYVSTEALQDGRELIAVHESGTTAIEIRTWPL